MKRIKIFIGSSIVDLREERLELMSFIQSLNNKYVDRDLFIEGYVCEETDSAMRLDGSQAQHNDYIKDDADVAIFMFYRKAGEFTLEELRLAREAFRAKGKPSVYVFYKAAENKEPAITEDIKHSIDVVFNEYGHYYKMFEHTDTIKLELLQALSDSLPGKPELLVKDGNVLFAGEPVSDISAANVFAYQNNPELQRLKDGMASAKAAMLKASSSGDFEAMLRYSKQYNELEETYHTLEKDILAMLISFTKESAKSAKPNPRRLQALRLLELGKVAEAKELITQEELNHRAESMVSRKKLILEQFRQEELDLVEDTKMRIQALLLDTSNPDRFTQIEAAYANAYPAAQDAKAYKFVLDYIAYLYKQKQYTQAIQVAEWLHTAYQSDVNIQDDAKANLLNLLGILYDGNGRPQEAEKLYKEALTIYRRLADENPAAFEADVADTCNNLGNLYADNGKPQEAEKLYLEALTIYRRLADENPAAYEGRVAMTCNNLGNLYADNGKPQEAEKLYKEALTIYRRLAKENPATFEGRVAVTCNNLGSLYKNGRPQEAEKLYLEALTICRRLARDNPAAFEADVAMTCYNLGNLYAKNGRPQEAEKLYLEALDIRRRLADENPAAYEGRVADTCNNLGNLYKNGRPQEAEKLYLEALDIRRRLA
ncbi:MAG: tetratricopeptide repeat protein [Clostridia bacterium]|nr:tetratricopeptide repeat protein [Clostridia bacterium]